MEELTGTLNNALDLVVDKVGGWLQALITMLPNLLVATLVLVGFYWLAKGARTVLLRGLGRITSNRQVVRLIGTVARIGVMIAGLFVALGILNLDKTVTSLLAGVGIVGLALGFAFQDLAQNFISGIIMSVRHQFRLDDLVEVNGIFGKVDAIDLRSTRIRRPSGETVTIPNRKVLDNAIVNFSRLGSRRVELEVGVSYDDDVAQAVDVVRGALEGLEVRAADRPVEAFATGFGGSSIDLLGRFWIDSTAQGEWLAARSQAIVAVKRALDDAGMSIPFPIRTLDFGDLDSVPLADLAREADAEHGHGAHTTHH